MLKYLTYNWPYILTIVFILIFATLFNFCYPAESSNKGSFQEVGQVQGDWLLGDQAEVWSFSSALITIFSATLYVSQIYSQTVDYCWPKVIWSVKGKDSTTFSEFSVSKCKLLKTLVSRQSSRHLLISSLSRKCYCWVIWTYTTILPSLQYNQTKLA